LLSNQQKKGRKTLPPHFMGQTKNLSKKKFPRKTDLGTNREKQREHRILPDKTQNRQTAPGRKVPKNHPIYRTIEETFLKPPGTWNFTRDNPRKPRPPKENEGGPSATIFHRGLNAHQRPAKVKKKENPRISEVRPPHSLQLVRKDKDEKRSVSKEPAMKPCKPIG